MRAGRHAHGGGDVAWYRYLNMSVNRTYTLMTVYVNIEVRGRTPKGAGWG